MSKRVLILALLMAVLLVLGMNVTSAAPLRQEEIYTVVLGDNLWTIAEKYLGSGPAYRAIAMATNAKHLEDPTFAEITNRSLIHPGWKLLIPSAEQAAEFLADVPPGIELTFWHVYGGRQGEALQAMLDDFNETNPWGITVIGENKENYTVLQESILVAISAGTPPHFAQAYQNEAAAYYEAEAIVPLEPYVESEKYGLREEELADYVPAFIAGDHYPEYAGAMLSFPPARSAQIMYYNVDWLNRLGYDAPPSTWDEFTQICKEATVDLDSDGNMDTFGFAWYPSEDAFFAWVWGRGGEIMNEAGTEATFNNDAAVAAANYLMGLKNSGCVYRPTETYGEQSDFAAQKVLFTFGSVAGLPYYARSVGVDEATGEPKFNWSVTHFPYDHSKVDEPVAVMYGPSLAIFETTPERQLASWLFIKWFTEPDQTSYWAQNLNYFPVRLSAIDSPEMQEYIAGNPQYAAAFDLVKYARAQPSVSGMNAVRSAVYDAMVRIWEGEDPKIVLDEAVAEANALIQE